MRARPLARPGGLVAAIALVAVTAADHAGALPAASLASRLREHLATGAPDSARALLRGDRPGAANALRVLLLDRARDVLASRPDSARAKLDDARSLARMIATEFADSVAVRLVAWHETLSADGLTAIVEGWDRYEDASRLYGESRHAEAQEILGRIVGVARAAGDLQLESWARTLRGSCLLAAGRMDEAREEYRGALEPARQLGDGIQEIRLLRNITLTYAHQQRGEEAIGTLRGVLAAARRVGWDAMIAEATNDLGIYHLQKGELDSALVRCGEALELARGQGQRILEGNVLTNLALVREQRGETAQAIALQEEALRIARETGGKRREAGALLNLASMYADLERHSRRIVLLRDALELAEELGSADVAARIRNEIGETYQQLGRDDEALRYHEEALHTLRRLGIRKSEAIALHNLGVVYGRLGRLDDALAAFEEAVRVAEGTADAIALAAALVDLGAVHELRGEREPAERRLRRALALADTLGNPVLRGNIQRALGRVVAAGGDGAEADSLFDAAIRSGRRTRSAYLLWRALADKADGLRARGQLAEADALLAEAIAEIESIRGRLAGDVFRLGFLANHKSIYVARVDVLFEMGPAAHREAFRVAEASRARSLYDALSGAVLEPRDVEPELQEQLRRRRARLGAAQTALSRAVSAGTWEAACVDSLEGALENAARETRELLERISARSPAFGAVAGQRPPLGPEEVQARILRPDQILLEYLVDSGESFLFVVTPGAMRLVRIPAGSAELEARVAELRAALLAEDKEAGAGSGTPRGRPAAEIAAELHRLLVEPARESLREGARLVIVPDGPLFHLPFGALRDDGGFLVERHAIACAPSASVLDPELRANAPSRARSLFAVGNPPSFRTQELLGAMVRGARDWRFGELPYAEEEARRVARHFARATVLVRDEATEEAVKPRMQEATHLHFATHGLLDETEPLMSGLVLAQDEDPAEDGILQMHEILTLDLAADLVVLSACNSGLGRIAGGEGVIGLTRSFLYAGARGLVISLWEVADRSTMELMDRFYGAYAQSGMLPDVALREAQLASIAEGAPARAWAGFAYVAGCAEEPHRHRASPARDVAIPLVLALLAAAAALAVARRRSPGKASASATTRTD